MDTATESASLTRPSCSHVIVSPTLQLARDYIESAWLMPGEDGQGERGQLAGQSRRGLVSNLGGKHLGNDSDVTEQYVLIVGSAKLWH